MLPYPFEPLDFVPKIEPLSADPATLLPYIDGDEPPKLFTERIGEFSTDGDREIKFDVSNRRILNKAILNRRLMIDLTEGIEEFVELKEVVGISHAMHWLNHQNPAGSSLKEAVNDSDFVVSGDALFQIAISPYGATENDHGSVIACASLKGLLLVFSW